MKHFPLQYAATQNNLGNAYLTITGIENRVLNCRKSIAAYKEALKVRTRERFPLQYATTRENLDAVYKALSEAEHKTQPDQSFYSNLFER